MCEQDWEGEGPEPSILLGTHSLDNEPTPVTMKSIHEAKAFMT
jgi:hypothetical protein